MTAAPQPSSPALGSSRAWIIWWVAALFYLYEFTQRISPSAMIPSLMRDFAISAAEVGFFSAVYFYAYSAMQLPVGYLADRYSVPKLLGFFATLVALGSWLQGITNDLHTAYFARALIGFGSSFAFIGCIKLSTGWFRPHQLPFVVGMTNIFGVLGAALGGRPLNWGIEQWGWRASFTGLTLLGFVIALLIFLIVRDGPASQKKPMVCFGGIKEVVSSSQVWILGLYATLLVLPLSAFGELWGVPFMKEAYGLTQSEATFTNSFIFFGIAFGSPIIGWMVSKRWCHPRWLMIGSTLIAATAFTLLIYYPLPKEAIRPLLFVYGFMTTNMLLCFSVVTLQQSDHLGGLAIGVVNTLITAGAAISQQGVGLLIERFDNVLPVLPDYRVAFCFLPIGLLLATFITYRIDIPNSLLPPSCRRSE